MLVYLCGILCEILCAILLTLGKQGYTSMGKRNRTLVRSEYHRQLPGDLIISHSITASETEKPSSLSPHRQRTHANAP
jgi:hypothetical protein